MSTKPDTKYAAKRRAANRKRIRDLGRNIFVYFFVGILVIGTASTVFIASSPASVPTTTAATTPTINNGAAFAAMLTQGDQALAAGKYEEAISFYSAYAQQVPTDADVMFKLGKAYVDPNNPHPDYLAGLDYLQRAVSVNPAASWSNEANALLSQYQGQANAAITATAASLSASPAVTGTAPALSGAPGITATTVITK